MGSHDRKELPHFSISCTSETSRRWAYVFFHPTLRPVAAKSVEKAVYDDRSRLTQSDSRKKKVDRPQKEKKPRKSTAFSTNDTNSPPPPTTARPFTIPPKSPNHLITLKQSDSSAFVAAASGKTLSVLVSLVTVLAAPLPLPLYFSRTPLPQGMSHLLALIDP